VEKEAKNLGHFCNFQVNARRKQLPNVRKFAQSAHPECDGQQERKVSPKVNLLSSYIWDAKLTKKLFL
jgi:hypothetical protein